MTLLTAQAVANDWNRDDPALAHACRSAAAAAAAHGSAAKSVARSAVEHSSDVKVLVLRGRADGPFDGEDHTVVVVNGGLINPAGRRWDPSCAVPTVTEPSVYLADWDVLSAGLFVADEDPDARCDW